MVWWARGLAGWMIAIGLIAAVVGLILILWNFSSREGSAVAIARGVWAISWALPLIITGMVLELLGSIRARQDQIERKIVEVSETLDRLR